MELNGHNNEYIILFGNDRYNPDLHYRACRYRFTSIRDAREIASGYYNAYIFKLHWNKGSDCPDIIQLVY